MQDLMPPINTQDSIFHDGDPTTGQLGTIVTALWLNNVQAATRDVQAEIKNVLAKAGMNPDPKKNNQLADAISQIVSSGNYASTAYVDNGLNKKIDKASISSVLGNDNSKVPSLSLLTTELGKKQPAGNYAPAGDYITAQTLNDGLSKKFDKTGGNVDGLISAKNEVAVTTNNSMMSMKTLDSVRGPHFVSKIENGAYRTHDLQDKSGVLMHLGDYGWGGVGAREDLTEQQVENKFKTGVTQVWRNQSNSTKYGPQFAASIYAKAYDTFLNISMGHSNGNITATSGVSGNSADTFKIANLYSDLNTSTDRNGCLRTSTNHELSDYPVGSPIPWSQSSPPAGYLVCNGQSFNKATYPLLAKAYPSGSLPDLRGEFIRGLDAGRNIDTGRTALSSQSDAIRNIVGTIHVHNTLSNDSVTGAFSKIGDTTQGWGLTTLSTSAGNIEFNAGNVVPVANENRPRSIAFLYIVRAA
ncbi:TPA: phage tail protein [Providencia alcalifaciens]